MHSHEDALPDPTPAGRRLLEVSEPELGNAGKWIRILTWEVEGPLGAMTMIEVVEVPEP